jgi:hypothetical protein
VKGNLEVVTASGKRSVYTPQLSEEPTLLHEEQRWVVVSFLGVSSTTNK